MATQLERKQDPTRVGFGMRLKAARINKDLGQKDVADRFGVTVATVSAWETGIGDPGVYRLKELAKLYGVSADVLLGDESKSDAMRFAAEFNNLNEAQKSTLKAVWSAFVNEAMAAEKNN